MTVSVVIPAFNAARSIGACVAACAAQTHPPLELIVVDDGSTDNTAEIVQALAGPMEAATPVRIVCLRQAQGGPAAARNAGAAAARGEVVAFTDSDCVPRADWLEQLLSAFDSDTVAAGGTYALANPESPLARLIQAEIAARHARLGSTVDFLGTFNVAYRKAAFDGVGGFDTAFRMASGEDNDLSYRLAQAGGILRFNPAAVVAHHHPVRLLPYLRTQARHGYWRVYLYRKHPRRSGGDAYANRLDFLLPPAALGLILASPVSGFLGGKWFAFAAGLALFAYALARLSVNLRVGMALSLPEQACFFAMSALRDCARGAGLFAGIYAFLLARRTP